MKKFIVALVLSLITVFPSVAQDNQNQISTEIENGWWININRVGENPFCAAAKGFTPHSSIQLVKDEFKIAIGYFPKILNDSEPNLFIIFAAPNWHFPNPNTEYAARIMFKYNGQADNPGDITLKRFIIPNELAFAFTDQFLEDLKKEGEMQIGINGHSIGGYPMIGIKKALEIIETCKSMMNVSNGINKQDMKDRL